MGGVVGGLEAGAKLWASCRSRDGRRMWKEGRLRALKETFGTACALPPPWDQGWGRSCLSLHCSLHP